MMNKGDKNLKFKEEIVLRHLYLVDRLIFRYRGFKNIYEDIRQEGYLGLLKAVEGYDISRNAKFKTYAAHCILGEIRHFLRDKCQEFKGTRAVLNLAVHINKFIDSYMQDYYRPPTFEEISREFKIPVEDLNFFLNIKKTYSLLELDENINYPEYENFKLPVEDKIVLIQAIARLKIIEKKIIYMFFYMDLTQTEIAKIIGIGQRKISRIINRSLKKLKDILTTSILK